MRRNLAVIVATVVTLVSSAPEPARAQASELKVSRGFSVLYLPMMVMEHEKLLQNHLQAAGQGNTTVKWSVLDGGNIINDAMLSGAVDIAAVGVPGFLTLWSKAKGNSQVEIGGLTGLSSTSMYVNTTNPNIKSLKDFTSRDKIAVAGIKTSLPAAVLQMAAAREFGLEHYAQLDPLTVGIPYPDATAAMISGKSEIDAHVASPPFSYMEADRPNIHRVVNSVDVLGNITMVMVATTKRFHDKNPALTAAFVAALTEANEIIARDPKKAVAIYKGASTMEVPDEMMLRILADKDTRFSVAPEGVIKWATFMHSAGLVRQNPTDWKELFFPEIHALQGS